jgi:hypothetical protein
MENAMKTMVLVAGFLAVMLVGCGGSAGVDIPVDTQAGKPPVTQQGDDGATHEDGSPSPGTPGADAAPEKDSAPVETLAQCTARVCSTRGYQCGALKTDECGGQQVDCGGCTPSYAVCGDNGNIGKCGMVCFNHHLENSACQNAGLPAAVVVNVTCGFPFGNDGSGRLPANYGCQELQANGAVLWCCPAQ